MPREAARAAEDAASSNVPNASDRGYWFSRETREALRPWIDLEMVGAEGLDAWLRSVARLLPPPRPLDSAPASPDPSSRVQELAAALVECAGDRAKVHFQAAEYFRENQALARRVKALEAAVEATAHGATVARLPPRDPDADRAAERYLPGGAVGP